MRPLSRGEVYGKSRLRTRADFLSIPAILLARSGAVFLSTSPWIRTFVERNATSMAHPRAKRRGAKMGGCSGYGNLCIQRSRRINGTAMVGSEFLSNDENWPMVRIVDLFQFIRVLTHRCYQKFIARDVQLAFLTNHHKLTTSIALSHGV